MHSLRRLTTVLALVTALLLPTAADARAGLVPPPWSGHSRANAESRPVAPRPPIDQAVAGGAALILVALLGSAGRVLTVRLA